MMVENLAGNFREAITGTPELLVVVCGKIKGDN